MPSISVIIPALNEEKLLDRTLSQFSDELRNTFHLEIIISDGGSTDGTIVLAQKYSSIIVENTSGKKQNISIGRNTGAAIATGEILVFLNADTLVDNAHFFFSAIISEFQRQNVVGATSVVRVYPEEERFADKIMHSCINSYFRFLNGIGIGMGRGECHVLRKKMFVELGGYNERIAAGEDYELFTRLRRKGTIKFLKNVIVYESPRRYRKFGYPKILALWFINAVSVLFFRKSLSKQWEAIR